MILRMPPPALNIFFSQGYFRSWALITWSLNKSVSACSAQSIHTTVLYIVTDKLSDYFWVLWVIYTTVELTWFHLYSRQQYLAEETMYCCSLYSPIHPIKLQLWQFMKMEMVDNWQEMEKQVCLTSYRTYFLHFCFLR